MLFDELLVLESSDMTPAEILACRPAMLHEHLQRLHAPLIAKTHDARSPMPGGVSHWYDEDTLGAVYLVRDPRDVAVSLSRHMGRSLDSVIELMAKPDAVLARSIDNLKRQLPEFWSSWSAHVNSWANGESPNTQVIRYEDFRAEPGKWAGLALKALGVSADAEALNRAVASTQLERLRQQEEQAGFVEAQRHGAFFGRGQVGGWKDVLSPAQARTIETDHYEVMRRFGYL
jgi:aryl sulfotransferase